MSKRQDVIDNENVPQQSLLQNIISDDTNIINNDENNAEKEEEGQKIETIETHEVNIEENNNPELLTLENKIMEEKTEIIENKDGDVTTTITKEETTIITNTEEKNNENEEVNE